MMNKTTTKFIKRNLSFFALHLFCGVCFSQGINNNWYFGNRAALNFSTDPPTSPDNSAMNQLESVGSISDDNGDLLFYTNGNRIWNREHSLMPNGTGLFGNDSAAQVNILPHPNNPNIYFVFTTSINVPNPNPVAYTIVDMNLGNIGNDGLPLGDVDSNSKNISLLDENGQEYDSTEAVTSVFHADGLSYWILIPNGTNLYSYRLDNNGFTNIPVTSELNFSLDFLGYIKISPELSPNFSFSNLISITHVALAPNDNADTLLSVYSFDNNTGVITDDYLLEVLFTETYASEFNLDSTLLYARETFGNTSGDTYVFDLFGNPDIFFRQFNTPNLSNGDIQRAPNGEIYVTSGGNTYLSRIINQNSFQNSSIELNSVFLNGNSCTIGLNQLIPVFSETNSCPEHLSLSNPETNTIFEYEVSNSITLNQNYNVSPGQDITVSAGQFIDILPSTYVEMGSSFLAEIEGCVARTPSRNKFRKYLDLREKPRRDAEKENSLVVYPTIVNKGFNITIEDDLITEVSIHSINSTPLVHIKNLKTDFYTYDIENYKRGIYFVIIKTINGDYITRRIIKE